MIPAACRRQTLLLAGSQQRLEIVAVLAPQRGNLGKFDDTHNNPPVVKIVQIKLQEYLARRRQIIKAQLGHSQLWAREPVVIRGR